MKLKTIYEDQNYLVEWYGYNGGILSIEDRTTGKNCFVGIKRISTGRDISISEFRSSLKSHGIVRAVATFQKMAAASY